MNNRQFFILISLMIIIAVLLGLNLNEQAKALVSIKGDIDRIERQFSSSGYASPFGDDNISSKLDAIEDHTSDIKDWCNSH